MDKPTEELRILMLEDMPSDARLEEGELRDTGLVFTLLRVDTREAFVQALDEFKPNIVLADYRLPAYNGREALEYTRRTHPQIPVIMVTGAMGDEAAVELLKLGARDYVLKDSLARLAPAIKRALSEERGIRARKAAEKALRQSEERYRNIFENARDVILTLSMDGVLTALSPSFEQITGWVRDEWLGKSFTPLVHPDDLPAAMHLLQRAIKGEALPTFELRILNKSGGYLCGEVTIAALTHDDEVTQLLGIARDITERKLAEARLNESEERFRTLVTATSQMVWQSNAAGENISDMPSWQEFTGQSSDEMRGYGWSNAIHPDDIARVTEQWNSAVATGSNYETEYRLRGRDGQYRIFAAKGVPIKEASGAVREWVGTCTDITERKRAEASLRESEEKFRRMSDSAYDAIIMMDGKGRISFWNKAAEMIFGYSAAEALGQDLHGLLTSPAIQAQAKRSLEHFFVSGEGSTIGRVMEVVALKKGGVEFPAELSTSAVRLGNEWHSIGILRDITERKHAEEALRRNNRTLLTLSAGNIALVKAVDVPQLLDAVCGVIVEKGEYRMAWVGYAEDNEAKSIIPVACRGVKKSELISLQLTWADAARGHGALARAIRSGQMQISRDILKDPNFEFYQKLAIANDWNANLAVPLSDGKRVFGALSIFSTDPDAFDAGEVALLNELGGDLAYGINALRTRTERDRAMERSRQHLDELRENLEDTIQAIAATVEMRDPYTAGHEKRVAELAVAIGREMGLAKEQLDGLRIAGNVHDVGKVKVPAEILSKPGALNDLEFGMIKLHPETGYEILRGINFPWPVATIVWQHHERLDGSGYPRGLSGSVILLEAQILAVADVVESIVSYRPYRPALGLDAALKEILDNRGKLYNADAVDACIRLFKEERFTFR